jgi:type II secretory pathway pseudopilin PulG
MKQLLLLGLLLPAVFFFPAPVPGFSGSKIVAAVVADSLPRISARQKQAEMARAYSTQAIPFQQLLRTVSDKGRKLQIRMAFQNTISAPYPKQKPPGKQLWQLRFLHDSGWRGQLPGQPTIFSYFSDCSGQPYRLTTTDILQIFKLSPAVYPLSTFPVCFPRGAHCNGKWVAVLTRKNKLIVQLETSYPDGNQTSWYYRKRYLFESVSE